MDQLVPLVKQLDLLAVQGFLRGNAPFENPNALSTGQPPFIVLMDCPCDFATEVYHELCAAGADPLLPFPEGATLLHFAASQGYKPICEDLLRRGADPASTAAALPPVAMAVKHPEVFALLLEAALRAAKTEQARSDVLTMCLIVACREANVRALRLLLDSGADPNAKSDGVRLAAAKVTALQMLTTAKKQDDAYTAACMLLDSGADPREKADSEHSPLVSAIDSGAEGVVRALLERGVSVSEGDEVQDEVSALTRAAARDSPQVCRLLLQHKAALDTSGRFGNALYQAILSGPSCIDLLIEAGANVNARTRDPLGLCLLHCSVEMCDAQVLASLLARGADPNMVDNQGRTALDYAARNMHYECAVILLECGADPAKANPTAATTLDVMRWLGEREAQMYGIETLADPHSALRGCFGVFTKTFERGFLWPNWTPRVHKLFPLNVRRAIFTVLLCYKRTECLLSQLPKVAPSPSITHTTCAWLAYRVGLAVVSVGFQAFSWYVESVCMRVRMWVWCVR
jgi:ankyrin repeat protein